MAENANQNKAPGFSVDWLVKGSLTKVGDIFDRLTGRGLKKASSLATSELTERLKRLFDAEAREGVDKRKYVPHNIRLKMQWDKFASDADKALTKLENELLIAAVDHINDKHYYTHAPLSIQVKPDYFTSGVMLQAGFEKLDGDEDGEIAQHITVDGLKSEDLIPAETVPKLAETVRLKFTVNAKDIDKTFEFNEGQRFSVGRTKENSIQIEDQSISKAHATLMLNKDGKIVVADTGSTNGTFVNGTRIPYGKAAELRATDKLMFGTIGVEVSFKSRSEPQAAVTEAYKVGDMHFKSRPATPEVKPQELSPIARPEMEIAKPKKADSFATNVAPQPALSEVDITVPEEDKA